MNRLPSETFDHFDLQQASEGVALLVLDNPPMNALSTAVLSDLRLAIDHLAGRKDIRVVVLTGAGRAFSAGAQISELRDVLDPAIADERIRLVHDLFDDWERLTQVTIAAVDGPALGGGTELALACDLRIIAAQAVMGLPEVKLGVIPGGGGTQRLVRTIGQAAATELVVSGRSVGAEECLRLGLVHRTSSGQTAVDAATSWAQELSTRPRLAVLAAKRAVQAAGGPEGFRTEREEFIRAASSRDSAEGITAFLEGRSPRYEHH